MKKDKIYYSRNEKLLRIVTFLGILLSEAVGVLLLIIGKTTAGIIALCACALASFLVSTFFMKKIKGWFGNKKKKRVIYFAFYALIIIIAMLTSAIASYNSAYDYAELRKEAVFLATSAAENEYSSGEVYKVDVFEGWESLDSYYYAIEVQIKVKGIGNIVVDRYSNYYFKINKYTGTHQALSSDEYTNAISTLD